MRTVAPEPKNVVIMVDTSSVLSRNQLATAKELAKQVLLALSPQDKVLLTMIPRFAEFSRFSVYNCMGGAGPVDYLLVWHHSALCSFLL